MSNSTKIRILLADDHSLFRRGVASVLRAEPDCAVVGEAADGVEAIALARGLVPDVVLMDVRMPRCSGLEATRQILTTHPQMKILMLSMTDDEDAVFEAIKNGAQGYLLKTAEPDELLGAVRGMFRGDAPLSNGLAIKLLREFARQANTPPEPTPPRPTLSPREKEVLSLVADGKTNRDIALILAVPENTVKNEIKRVRHKLQLENRVQAAVFAVGEDAASVQAA